MAWVIRRKAKTAAGSTSAATETPPDDSGPPARSPATATRCVPRRRPRSRSVKAPGATGKQAKSPSRSTRRPCGGRPCTWRSRPRPRTTKALEGGLSPRSVLKYHVVLHGIFARAVRDRVIAYNPAADTDLPKVVNKRARIITPEECERLLAAVPDRYRVLVLVAIETGMRWGELAALRPRHLDVDQSLVRVQETIVEVSKKDSPTGQRMIVKAYSKDNEPRTLRIRELGLGLDNLLFGSTRIGGQTPMSRNTFRNRGWLPATKTADLPGVRIHDLRHAHASWFLAGGADLKTVMDRLGHTQIQTTHYLHALPGADDQALAYQRTRHPSRPDHGHRASASWRDRRQSKAKIDLTPRDQL